MVIVVEYVRMSKVYTKTEIYLKIFIPRQIIILETSASARQNSGDLSSLSTKILFSISFWNSFHSFCQCHTPSCDHLNTKVNLSMTKQSTISSQDPKDPKKLQILIFELKNVNNIGNK